MEFVYEPEPDRLWGVSYQATEEFADYASERYSLLFGRRLNDLVMFKLEYSHGIYDEFATGGQDTDATLRFEGRKALIQFIHEITLSAGEVIDIELS